MQEKKLVVFDLDGTLNQAHLFTLKSHREALREFGVTDMSDEALMATLGNQYAFYRSDILPGRSEEEYARYWKLQQEREAVNRATDHAAYPGVIEMLSALKDGGYFTAICTNAHPDYGHEIATLLGFHHLIDYVQGIVPGHSKVASLRKLLADTKAKTVMVGDRIFDLQAARENNVPFIGCLYGYNPAEMETADIQVNAPLDIVPAVEQLMA